ncbi:hypothetical protein GCM10017774_08870 [Lentzea cavernae]|uniref:Uncharacterized protein n=2 Tax=Lentzea cavernae TaxID=2020703 RepID=A0ABQ3MAB5_9PSEU|nr:hypothetical protein GCM10017774_08870 [Lentzea cavernae]
MLCMTGTPIFDELYAKYVSAAPARAAATPPAPTLTAPREPRHEQVVPQYAGSFEVPEWPS